MVFVEALCLVARNELVLYLTERLFSSNPLGLFVHKDIFHKKLDADPQLLYPPAKKQGFQQQERKKPQPRKHLR